MADDGIVWETAPLFAHHQNDRCYEILQRLQETRIVLCFSSGGNKDQIDIVMSRLQAIPSED